MISIDLAMSMPSENSDGGDIKLSAPDEQGRQDIALEYGHDAIKQVVYARIKTLAPDWFHHPNMGGNLEDLIGEPNTRETAQKGVKMIEEALMYEDFLSPGSFAVKAIPIDRQQILFVIKLFFNNEEVVVPIQFDYQYGMKLV